LAHMFVVKLPNFFNRHFNHAHTQQDSEIMSLRQMRNGLPSGSGRIRTLLPLTERTPLPNPLPTSWGEGIGRSHGSSVKMHPVVVRHETCLSTAAVSDGTLFTARATSCWTSAGWRYPLAVYHKVIRASRYSVKTGGRRDFGRFGGLATGIKQAKECQGLDKRSLACLHRMTEPQGNG
jgi:hypothetical protein